MLTTSIHLLERVRHPEDEAAWERFVALYSPLLLRWTRRWGLSADEGLDVVQEVLVTLLKQLPEFRYDPTLGRFRGWLKTIAWRQAASRSGRQLVQAGGISSIDPPAPQDDPAEEIEHRAYLVRRALELMKTDFEDTTWRACWDQTVRGQPAAEVARALGLSEGAVYVAKCRVLKRLREEILWLWE